MPQNQKKTGWDLYKYVALHKEQHTMMESLDDHGYSGIDGGTKVHHFLQEIISTELETAVNIVWAQPEKHVKDFDTMVSYLSQTVTKEACNMQSLHIAKTRGQQGKPRVAVFMGKIELKKYPKAVWNSMSKEQYMQVRQSHEQQCIKPTARKTNAETCH